MFARKNLDLIFSLQFERTVNRDNTVKLSELQLRMTRVRWEGRWRVSSSMVHPHLDAIISLTHGPHRLGRYEPQGVALTANKNVGGRTLWKRRAVEKYKNRLFPALGNPAKRTGFPLSHSADGYGYMTKPKNQNRTFHLLQKPDILTCYEHLRKYTYFGNQAEENSTQRH